MVRKLIEKIQELTSIIFPLSSCSDKELSPAKASADAAPLADPTAAASNAASSSTLVMSEMSKLTTEQTLR